MCGLIFAKKEKKRKGWKIGERDRERESLNIRSGANVGVHPWNTDGITQPFL